MSNGEWFYQGIDTTGMLNSVTCPTASFCIAEDGINYFTYSSTKWSGPKPLSGGHNYEEVVAMACASASWCVSSTLLPSTFSTFDGNWSVPMLTSMQIFEIACAPESLCIGIAYSGHTNTSFTIAS